MLEPLDLRAVAANIFKAAQKIEEYEREGLPVAAEVNRAVCDAEDVLAALRATRAALEPFAAAGEHYRAGRSGKGNPAPGFGITDLLRAAAVLASVKDSTP